MKTEVKKIDSTTREVIIEAQDDIVKNKFEDVFKRIAKEAKVQGFRPGNAPRDIIEKNYSSHANEQVLKELVPDLYNEAIKKENLDVIEMPEITDVKLDRSKISFKATVEVSPEIILKDYKGLKVSYKKVTVTADELKRNIDSLKEMRKVENIDDNFAKGIGYPNLAELGSVLEKQLLLHKHEQERQKAESGIIEQLTGALDFKLPKSLVERQMQDLLKHARVDLAMKGIAREEIAKQESELLKNLEPEAKKQVKVYLVLAEIAKKENIPLDDNMPRKVIELLLKEADWTES